MAGRYEVCSEQSFGRGELLSALAGLTTAHELVPGDLPPKQVFPKCLRTSVVGGSKAGIPDWIAMDGSPVIVGQAGGSRVGVCSGPGAPSSECEVLLETKCQDQVQPTEP